MLIICIPCSSLHDLVCSPTISSFRKESPIKYRERYLFHPAQQEIRGLEILVFPVFHVYKIWSSCTPSYSRCWRKSFFSRNDLPERRNPVIIFMSPLPLERLSWSMYVFLFIIMLYENLSLMIAFRSKCRYFFVNKRIKQRESA